ncbi:GntP family permease [Noviherbaspirillum sp.]|uniref:GntP family permease n=1 Tax=Noviherbaspirillum sp. TaxID=1926288 RepID=UPI002D7231E6|nr:GntP family permease [Noviherbaspirillum sp.]HZW22702.1 GntP family permease [Noviherbaspirillum sp.]
MTGITAILVSLVLLMFLAYRGVSVLLLAPLLAALAAFLSQDVPVLAGYTQVFMKALGNFIVLYFPLFLLGAIFGKLMEASGAAGAIADWIVARLGRERAVLAVVLACAVLTYGGVSLFVVAFGIYPVASALFRQADVPKRLIPASIALGAFTFTMTALPGTPAIQNAIPMPFFKTTPFAAPGLGVIAGLVMLAFGMVWLLYRARRAAKAAEGYGEPEETPLQQPDKTLRPLAQGEGYDLVEVGTQGAGRPGIAVALFPILLVVALNYVFSRHLFPALDTGYLALPQYGATALDQLIGLWSIICALLLSNLAILVLNLRRLPGVTGTLDDGASASALPIFNTASLVGFGAVIASLPAFAMIRDAVLHIAPGNPLISLSIAVNILAGITGSASGGMSIALQTLGASYLDMARQTGTSPELLHRVAAIATGGLDSLPHNGAVITLLSICKLGHRQAYPDIFMVAVVGPLAALAVVVLLATWVGAF